MLLAILFVTVTAVGLLSNEASAQEVVVSSCGQTLTNKSAVLAADLDCTGFAGDAITLEGGSLDLRGFTLTGGDNHGVRCPLGCQVFSVPAGGTITGAAHDGISIAVFETPVVATISDIVLSGNGSPGTFVSGVRGPDAAVRAERTVSSTVKLNNVTIDGNTGHGVAVGKVTCNNCTIINNAGDGIDAQKAKARDSVFDANGGAGINATKASAINSTFTNNGATDPFSASSIPPAGVVGLAKVKLKNVTASNNTPYGTYCFGGKHAIKDSTVENNAVHGIFARGCKSSTVSTTISGHPNGVGLNAPTSNGKIKGSTITGNMIGVDIDAKTLKILDSNITNNALHGVRATATDSNGKGVSMVVRRSIITGNNTGATCGVTDICADITADAKPKMIFALGINECTISQSIFEAEGVNLGVCEFDCQNGVLNPGEECDSGAEASSCDDDCTLVICGDFNVNQAAGEQCDDGAVVSEDGCDANCILEFCGDLIVQAGLGESCDEGAVDTATCDFNCSLALCGDGYRNKRAGEKCDDGNTDNGDGCSATCLKE